MSRYQPVISSPAACPGLPHMFPHELPALGLPYTAVGMALLPRLMHYFYNPLNTRENRRLVLQRSVFDLISAHPYLTLDDSKLLDWFHCLSAEDRDIIHDEGGFYHFLQRHPGVELFMDPVFLKYAAMSAPVHQTVTSSQHTAAGSKTYTYEELYEEVHYTKQPVHHQTSFQAVYQNPGTEKPRDHTVFLPLSHMNEDGQSLQTDSRRPSLSEWSTAVKECPSKDRGTDATGHKWSMDDRPLLEPDDENTTEEMPQDEAVPSDESVIVNDEDQSDFHSIMEDIKSVLVCQPREDNPTSPPVTMDTSCDVMVGNDPTLSTSASTQTQRPETADKHVITEVHMTDLDYLTEEFIKLKTKQDLNEKMKSSGRELREKCDCVQRVRETELSLLTLQHSVCRQHCWRLYCSSEGHQPSTGTKELPADVLDVLQKLDSDYNQMKQDVLAGVPLEQLKPLSIDCERIMRGRSYSPAQIVLNTSASLQTSPRYDRSRTSSQVSQNEDEPIKKDSVKTRRAVALMPQDGACEEVNTSEAWYDAEEDLEPPETGQHQTSASSHPEDVTSGEEARSSALCVSNLPTDMTEGEVMLLFEKYGASEVRVSALTSGFRVAIVMVRGLQSAEAAVTELSGCRVRGHALCLEHIGRGPSGTRSQDQDSGRGTESEPQSSKTRQLVLQPPLCSTITTRKMVSVPPAAKGAFVPQRYGTMDSLDALTAELTQLHPDAGRQRILDALVELRKKHRGVLRSLPLRTVREMTSEILTRPASASASASF